MKADILKRAGIFVIFVLAQAIVLGRIHLFHYATPLFYVYFVLGFERNHPKWAILLWSAILAFIIWQADIALGTDHKPDAPNGFPILFQHNGKCFWSRKDITNNLTTVSYTRMCRPSCNRSNPLVFSILIQILCITIVPRSQ